MLDRPTNKPSLPPQALPPEILPGDPRVFLAQQQQLRRFPRVNLLFLLIAFIIAAEIFASPMWKPSKRIGMATSNVQGEVMDEANRAHLDRVEQEEVAARIANREAEFSAWKGRCALVAMVDVEAAQLCMAAAYAYFGQSLPPARRYRDNYRTHRYEQ